ncbi:adenylyl cyclase-associated protein [Salpingoeca rosetta]|uniref:Adenylyl cyclase-associated protein n=1 Tax=Salpingoeca rosetta (strain ATCC 50818 / BSB-021) TaxID=946362 RepID=F2UPX5_SALR5|nr:adenylyl cyclase-associated protein [Salpingoeca rosetta]EGD79805.1 adenylyl cyclase-associated protein [Salpingoeca rosetta]|eukprot:XP_004988754.1 adenylyl cyclase-associated protein [Salpingoeca rosetta]
MSNLESLVQRLEKVAVRLEGAASRGGSAPAPAQAAPAGGAADDSASVSGYDELLSGPFADFLAKGRALGGDLATQLDIVERAFHAQREFIVVASKAKQPSQDVLMKLLHNTSSALAEVQSFRESNRRSNQFNHLSAVSEGIPCLGWVTIAPKPAPYVREMKDAAQFYTNRVLMEFKDKDQSQVDWAKSWVAVLDGLYDYIKDIHTTGLVWNNRDGVDASTFVGTAAPAAPKPAAPKPAAVPSKSEGSDTRASLFAALNKGGGVTAGLKKVEKSQMTHKNPALRATSVVSASAAKPTAAKPAAKPAAAVQKKDPVFELVGKKWTVEYQVDNHDIVIEGNIKQSVYIYKCEKTTIKISGKVNSITLDNCKKVGVVFDSAVGVFDVVNCKSVQVQVVEKVPTVSIDKTDGCQVYLSATSLDTEIVSAKSSEMNVLIPEGDNGDYKEMPVPEQYKTKVVNGSLATEATDIAG